MEPPREQQSDVYSKAMKAQMSHLLLSSPTVVKYITAEDYARVRFDKGLDPSTDEPFVVNGSEYAYHQFTASQPSTTRVVERQTKLMKPDKLPETLNIDGIALMKLVKEKADHIEKCHRIDVAAFSKKCVQYSLQKYRLQGVFTNSKKLTRGRQRTRITNLRRKKGGRGRPSSPGRIK